MITGSPGSFVIMPNFSLLGVVLLCHLMLGRFIYKLEADRGIKKLQSDLSPEK